MTAIITKAPETVMEIEAGQTDMAAPIGEIGGDTTVAAAVEEDITTTMITEDVVELVQVQAVAITEHIRKVNLPGDTTTPPPLRLEARS